MNYEIATQHDGKLEDGVLYPCSQCGYPGLNKENSAWKWGLVECDEYSECFGNALMCKDQNDCYRRSQFMNVR